MASAEMLVLVSHIAPVSAFLKTVGFGVFADIPILGGITPSCLPFLAYISILVTEIGYACYFLAIETTSAAVASIVFYVKPALAPTAIPGIVLITSGSAITLAGAVRKKTN